MVKNKIVSAATSNPQNSIAGEINPTTLSAYMLGDLDKRTSNKELPGLILHVQEMKKFVENEMMDRERALDEKHPVKNANNNQKVDTSEEFQDVMTLINDLKLFGISIPEEYDGEGLPSIFTNRLITELSSSSPAIAVTMSVSYSVQHAFKTFGTEAQKAEYLNRFAKGEIGAICITESNAGSDAKSMTLSAVKDGDDYILNGNKIFITSAGIAGTYLVFANTEPGELPRDNKLTTFIIDANTPGLTVGKLEEKWGQHASPTAEMILKDCRVPASNILGVYNNGWKVLLNMLTDGRIGIASLAMGIANRVYTEASEHARGREQFGKPIAEQAPIITILTRMKVRNIAAQMLIDFAAYLKDNFSTTLSKEERKQLTKEENQIIDEKNNAIITGASLAKLFSSENAKKGALEAIQVLGGVGFTKESAPARFLNDSLVTTIYEGTSQIQKLLISRHYNLNAFFGFLNQLDIESNLLKAQQKLGEELIIAEQFVSDDTKTIEKNIELLKSILDVNDQFQHSQDRINRFMQRVKRDKSKIEDRLLHEIISFVAIKLVLYRTSLILNLPKISPKKLKENLSWMESLLQSEPQLFLSHQIPLLNTI